MTTSPSITTFKIARGATRSWTVEVKDQAGLVDLTGAKIAFIATIGDKTIRKLNTAAGGGDSQIEVLSTGRYRVKFGGSDTSGIYTRQGTCESWVVTADEQNLQTIEPSPFLVTKANSSPP